MTDYNYGNHQAPGLTDNSSENYARDIDGYEITVHPQSNWPGLDADPKQVRFNHDQMIQVANWLDQAANDLGELPNNLGTNMGQVAFGPQNWPPAKALGRANDQVKGAVSKYTTELITTLKEAAASIRAAAGANQQADDTSATTSNTQSAQL